MIDNRKQYKEYKILWNNFFKYLQRKTVIAPNANGRVLVITFDKNLPIKVEKTKESIIIYIDEAIINETS